MGHDLMRRCVCFCGGYAGLVLLPGLAAGQGVRSGGLSTSTTTTGSASAGLSGWANTPYVSPYVNPSANPFLNPYMSVMPMNSQNMALSFIAAQRMSGGIGSGQVGGPSAPGNSPSRPARGAIAAATARATVEPERASTANTPGGKASRYFTRPYINERGSQRYFQRESRHFPGAAR